MYKVSLEECVQIQFHSNGIFGPISFAFFSFFHFTQLRLEDATMNLTLYENFREVLRKSRLVNKHNPFYMLNFKLGTLVRGGLRIPGAEVPVRALGDCTVEGESRLSNS